MTENEYCTARYIALVGAAKNNLQEVTVATADKIAPGLRSRLMSVHVELMVIEKDLRESLPELEESP